MAGRRKLFITHAGELAHRLVCSVGRDGLVARFVRSYAEHHNRPGLLSYPAQAREMESTIGREALLVMAVEVRRMLPRAFGVIRRGAPAPEQNALADQFSAEFLAALERGFDWSPDEAAIEQENLRRDLEMYRRWSVRVPAGAAPAPGDANRSPFADRCALLLDPAMMEQARRAAADFEVEIARTAARIFGRLGRRASPAAKKSTHRVRRPLRKAARSRSLTRRPSRRGKRGAARGKRQPRRRKH